MSQEKLIVVLVTVTSIEQAEIITSALLEQHLASCVSRISGVFSRYRWQGKIEGSEECLLLVKSRLSLFDRLERTIKELHSYEVPEIIALDAQMVSSAYWNWVLKETILLKP